ncbi:MAG: FkbM family methyltransferase [Planctomycetota bacterium]
MLLWPPWRLRALVRTAVHARSLRAAWRLHTERVGPTTIRLPGFAGTFRFRSGTSDARLLRGLVERGLPPEYEWPADLRPRVILDIGANIGAVTAALVRRYPEARIFAFEPLPENFDLLRHNVAQFARVTPVPYGLGAATESRPYTRSDDPRNFGGGGFHGGRADHGTRVSGLAIVAVEQALRELHIEFVDAIKIDTEGAEHDILMSFPPAVLRQVQVIVGELHGKPGDTELLDYLGRFFRVARIERHGRVKWFRALAPPDGPAALRHVDRGTCGVGVPDAAHSRTVLDSGAHLPSTPSY